MTIDEARTLLRASGFCFDADDGEAETPEEAKKWEQTLNMNDVWSWASADCEHILDEELPEVARLFKDYGWCGILYWVSQKHNGMISEFTDNNRFIEFVRNEEAIKQEVPDYNRRAYVKKSYTITGEPTP